MRFLRRVERLFTSSAVSAAELSDDVGMWGALPQGPIQLGLPVLSLNLAASAKQLTGAVPWG